MLTPHVHLRLQDILPTTVTQGLRLTEQPTALQEALASVTQCSGLEVDGTNDYHGGHT